MGDDMMPDANNDIQNQPNPPEQQDPDENLGLDDQEENPMDTQPGPDEQTPPENQPDQQEQAGKQQEDYKPFSEDMPDKKKDNSGTGLAQKAAGARHKGKNGGSTSYSQKGQKVGQLEQLKQKMMSKRQKKLENDIKPYKKLIRKLNKKLETIEDKTKKNRNKMIRAAMMLAINVSIALIIIVIGLIFTITIILAIPIGFPLLETGGIRLLNAWASFSTKMAMFIKERLKLYMDKKTTEKLIKKQQKLIKKTQARSNRLIGPLLKRIDSQIQKLQKS